jgi:hypothetical protein
MKAVILDGSRSADDLGAVREALEAELRAAGYEVETLPLAEMTIAPCGGCFGCWIKTPGRCAIEDDAERVMRALLPADLQVYFSSVVFGGYSGTIKRAIERMIPRALPFFLRRDGEIHHPMRYEKRSSFLAIGVLPRPDPDSEAVFLRLAERNARNYQPLAWAAGVLPATDAPEALRARLRELVTQVQPGVPA